jgi:hypothetical protein
MEEYNVEYKKDNEEKIKIRRGQDKANKLAERQQKISILQTKIQYANDVSRQLLFDKLDELLNEPLED